MKLITGANGRIGNVLVKELNRRGEKVKVLVRKTSDLTSLKDCNCEYIYGDILDIASFEDHLDDVDMIFHLAAHINISTHDKEKTYTTNIEGTKNIVELCLRKNIKLIYTSSIHAISSLLQDTVITEDTPLCIYTGEDIGPYNTSKAQATQVVLDAISNGLQAIIYFPTGVIGPYDYQPSYFGSSIINLIKAGLNTTVEGKYDYADVRDVVDAILKGVELEKYGKKYILSGECIDMVTITKYLREFTEKKEKRNILRHITVLNFKLATFIGKIATLFSKKTPITPYSMQTLNSNCNISHDLATKELEYNPRDVKTSLHDQYIWFKENGYIK